MTEKRISKSTPSQAVFTATGKLLGAVDLNDVMLLNGGDPSTEENTPMLDEDGRPIPIPTDLKPAPSSAVEKAALRSAAEAKIENEAIGSGMAAARAVRAGTLSPAGALLALHHANARAAEQIKRLRASAHR